MKHGFKELRGLAKFAAGLVSSALPLVPLFWVPSCSPVKLGCKRESTAQMIGRILPIAKFYGAQAEFKWLSDSFKPNSWMIGTSWPLSCFLWRAKCWGKPLYSALCEGSRTTMNSSPHFGEDHHGSSVHDLHYELWTSQNLWLVYLSVGLCPSLYPTK